MFKTGSILDIFGAIILLAAIAVVVKNPAIVTSGGSEFNKSLSTAVSG